MLTANPAATTGNAGLAALRSVYSVEANPHFADVERVAVDHPRTAGERRTRRMGSRAPDPIANVAERASSLPEHALCGGARVAKNRVDMVLGHLHGRREIGPGDGRERDDDGHHEDQRRCEGALHAPTSATR